MVLYNVLRSLFYVSFITCIPLKMYNMRCGNLIPRMAAVCHRVLKANSCAQARLDINGFCRLCCCLRAVLL
jgi:hypothetical protein